MTVVRATPRVASEVDMIEYYFDLLEIRFEIDDSSADAWEGGSASDRYDRSLIEDSKQGSEDRKAFCVV